MIIWLQYLIALVVFAHGLVYLNGGLGRLAGLFEGWKGRSLLFRSTITGSKLKQGTRALWIISGLGTILTAIAIAFASSLLGLWTSVGIVSSIFAIVSFLVFWDGQLKRSINEGLIGALMSLIILLSAIAYPLAFS